MEDRGKSLSLLLRNDLAYQKGVFHQESAFEAACLQQLPSCLPEFRVIPFKPLLKGASGIRRRADLALVHQSFRMWFIVEVELSSHSLSRHVFPQMEAISTGQITDKHASYLERQLPDATPSQIVSMTRYCPPGHVVVVDSARVMDRGWSSLRDDLGVELSFLEVYRSAPSDDVIFAFSGFRPEMTPQRLASGKYSRFLNALEFRPLDKLPVSAKGELLIEHESATIAWQVIVASDHAVAFPPADVTLTGERNYELLLTDSGGLRLRVL